MQCRHVLPIPILKGTLKKLQAGIKRTAKRTEKDKPWVVIIGGWGLKRCWMCYFIAACYSLTNVAHTSAYYAEVCAAFVRPHTHGYTTITRLSRTKTHHFEWS